ncbi:hypothetical protein ABXK61_13140 [Burkholderia sola]|uniref:hypothetical protein n=1 Tax=Burkholderia TaxID=32008 RepID=UPI001AE3C494|nr:hypothetical protein [Burkholderia sp. AcTa6-5]MBP0714257.1 hypothetical protein [Burkholderia sp. AcTa6-5]
MKLIDILMPALVSSVVGAVLITISSWRGFGATSFIFGGISLIVIFIQSIISLLFFWVVNEKISRELIVFLFVAGGIFNGLIALAVLTRGSILKLIADKNAGMDGWSMIAVYGGIGLVCAMSAYVYINKSRLLGL